MLQRPAILILLLVAIACSGRVPRRVNLELGPENLHRVTSSVYCGGEPRGAEAFAALAALGVRTIVSVDGLPPDTQAARRHGMRYVHLPIGYDTIERSQAVRIVKAATDLEGPIYIHCHHGRNRAVAAAAVVAMATQGWPAQQAVHWMRRAGASEQYHGLYEAVRRFHPPSADERDRQPPAPQLPETVDSPPMRQAMAQIDRIWDALRADSAREMPRHALLLAEQYRELLRRPETAAHGDDLLDQLQRAEGLALRLRDHGGEAELAAVARSCRTCHVRYRD